MFFRGKPETEATKMGALSMETLLYHVQLRPGLSWTATLSNANRDSQRHLTPRIDDTETRKEDTTRIHSMEDYK